MYLTNAQRALFLLGMVLAFAFLPLIGGLHHHDHGDEAGELCWFCAATSAASLPMGISLVALALAGPAFDLQGLSVPSRFPWMARHRRGPPSFSQA